MNVGKLVLAASVLVAFQALPVSADPITLSLVSPTNPTVTEGNQITLLFEAVNSSSFTYGAGGNGQGYSFVSGDMTDIPSFDSYNYSPAGYAGCSSSVAAGNSCFFSATYNTPSDTGESDGDSGVYQVFNTVTFSSTDGGAIDYAGIYTDITVQDAASSSPVPEPDSLALFASALLGLGFAFRNRLRKAS